MFKRLLRQPVENKGFTLIEVLMVVLIVGVLASLAMPQYTKVVEKAKMSEAKTVLSAMRTAQGVHFIEADEYASDTADLDLDEDIFVSDKFTYAINDVTNVGYTLVATRTGGSYDGETISMTEDGTMTGSGSYSDLL